MKVYTEVVYTWDDTRNELVEESSKSFDYEGEVTQCWGSRFRWRAPSLPKIIPKVFKKPKIVAKAQAAAAGGIRQMKTNLHTATTKARENVHGIASSTKEGVNLAHSNVKALGKNLGAAMAVKTISDITKAVDKELGGQAGGSKQAMGASTEVLEKSGKFGSKGQLAKSKRKKSNTGKELLKVKPVGGGKQYA
tara:strand:- start:161 stop:739 length:579 start_codon:yes stop_codon:yes gene_type:complete